MAIDINGITLNSANGSALTVQSGATNWLTCDANGVMRNNSRPYLWARLQGQGVFYKANPVTFGGVVANVGNCWNNSTGAFTCPVAGRYLVGMGGIGSGSGNGTLSYGYFYIMKNGGVYHFSHWNFVSFWEYVSLSGIVDCNAGDTIGFQIHPSFSSFYGEYDHGNFFITLLR